MTFTPAVREDMQGITGSMVAWDASPSRHMRHPTPM